MQPGRAASLGNREQLFGGEVSRLSVRALFFAGLEGYEGLPLPDATGTSAEHPGAKHGTSGSPRAQPRAAWSDSVSERDVHRALAGRYKNSTSPRLSLPTSSGMNETLNKDNSKPPRRIDAAKCHCSLKDGSNNQQGRSKTKQQGTSGWPISRRVLYALPLLDCPDDCASGACDITEESGLPFLNTPLKRIISSSASNERAILESWLTSTPRKASSASSPGAATFLVSTPPSAASLCAPCARAIRSSAFAMAGPVSWIWSARRTTTTPTI